MPLSWCGAVAGPGAPPRLGRAGAGGFPMGGAPRSPAGTHAPAAPQPWGWWTRARRDIMAPGREEWRRSCHPCLPSLPGKRLERVGVVAAGPVGAARSRQRLHRGFTNLAWRGGVGQARRLTSTLMVAVAVAYSPNPSMSAAWITKVYSGTVCGDRLRHPKQGASAGEGGATGCAQGSPVPPAPPRPPRSPRCCHRWQTCGARAAPASGSGWSRPKPRCSS